MEMNAGKLIIFDLDGTLVDSLRDITASINHALTGTGAEPIDEVTARTYIGRPLDEIFLDLIGDGDRERAGRAAEVYRRYFFDNCARHSRLYPGVAGTLDRLRGVYRLAVATTKQTFMAVRVVDLMELEPYFEKVQGTDGFPAKPDPAVIHGLLEDFGLKSPDAVMVGDTVDDVEAGRRAGVFTCAVTYGAGREDDLKAVEPNFVIDSFDRLPGVLDRLWRS